MHVFEHAEASWNYAIEPLTYDDRTKTSHQSSDLCVCLKSTSTAHDWYPIVDSLHVHDMGCPGNMDELPSKVMTRRGARVSSLPLELVQRQSHGRWSFGL
jgi:hypothetical protein